MMNHILYCYTKRLLSMHGISYLVGEFDWGYRGEYSTTMLGICFDHKREKKRIGWGWKLGHLIIILIVNNSNVNSNSNSNSESIMRGCVGCTPNLSLLPILPIKQQEKHPITTLPYPIWYTLSLISMTILDKQTHPTNSYPNSLWISRLLFDINNILQKLGTRNWVYSRYSLVHGYYVSLYM